MRINYHILEWVLPKLTEKTVSPQYLEGEKRFVQMITRNAISDASKIALSKGEDLFFSVSTGDYDSDMFAFVYTKSGEKSKPIRYCWREIPAKYGGEDIEEINVYASVLKNLAEHLLSLGFTLCDVDYDFFRDQICKGSGVPKDCYKGFEGIEPMHFSFPKEKC